MATARRLTPRIVPPSPITLAIEDETGDSVAYGVIADISGAGACVWTEAALSPGQTFSFRISFAEPPDVHELVGIVVWTEPSDQSEGRGGCRSGVEWLGATRACRERLRDLAGRAVQPAGSETYLFQARWKVGRATREPRHGGDEARKPPATPARERIDATARTGPIRGLHATQ